VIVSRGLLSEPGGRKKQVQARGKSPRSQSLFFAAFATCMQGLGLFNSLGCFRSSAFCGAGFTRGKGFFNRLSIRSVLLALALCAALPSCAHAWEQQTHHTAANEIVNYLPQSLRNVAKKHKDALVRGIDEEPELYDAALNKHGRHERSLFIHEGVTRLLFHIERIRFFMERPDKAESLAYSLGQFTRCAADLLEPQPEDGKFAALESAATRMYFMADFQKNNPKFRMLPSARERIGNFPQHVEALLKKSAADGEAIYRVYRAQRNYPAADNAATASFNRILNFLVNALTSLESMTRKQTDLLLDMRNWLGIDSLRRYNESDKKLKIDKPDAPDKPKAPSGPKVKK